MITMTQYAFSKLRWFRENCNENTVGTTNYPNPSFLEVSLMGISESEENLSKIIDFRCVKQECTGGTTELDDDGLAIFFEDMLEDEGISPKRCGRVWAHTHPGASAIPSGTDNDTWNKYFQGLDFAVMYILADGNDSCRVRYMTNIFGTQNKEMPVQIELKQKTVDGNHMLISPSTVFEFDKMFKEKEQYINCANIFVLGGFAKYEAEWKEELVRNVKKKSYQTFSGGYTHPTHRSHYPTTTPNGTATFTNGARAGVGFQQAQTQAEKEAGKKISNKSLLQLLIRNNKDSVNAFGHAQLEELASKLKITKASLYDAQSFITMSESNTHWDELLDHEKKYKFVTLSAESGMINTVDLLRRDDLEDLCVALMVRPSKLKSLVDEYIKAFGTSLTGDKK